MKKTLARAAATAGAFVAAGITAKVFQERSDERRRLTRGEEVPFGSVRGEHLHVETPGGMSIHVEIDEADPELTADVGVIPTVVFLHGWMCDLDSWHFQRLALRGRSRMLFIEHRSHGKSSRSGATNSSLDDLTEDLETVLTEVVPEGPIVLVGHSMGGMTIMKFAHQHPHWFDERVVGTVLVATSSGKLMKRSPFIQAVAQFLRFGQPLLDWGRGFNSRSVIRRWVVGPDASNLAVELTNEMFLRTPSTVLADFIDNFLDLDLGEGLPTIAKTRTSIVAGTKDLVTPFRHSVWLNDRIENSEFVSVPGAGHMVMFEEPEQVTEAIERVLKDVGQAV